MKKVSLVFGSGGARGLSFIGALRALLENGIRVDEVVGSSMGAIVGAAFCSGSDLDEIAAVLKGIKLKNFIHFDIFGPAFFAPKGVENLVRKLLKCEQFEELRISLKVVCTDLQKGKPVMFEKGPLLPPVIGSSVAAGVFTPVHYMGTTLIDGGYSQPVPIKYSSPDAVVIAIDPSVKPDWRLKRLQRRSVFNIFSIGNVFLQMLKSFDTLI